MKSVDELLSELRHGDRAHDASMALGLMLEDRPAEQDAELASAVGPELASRHLSGSERTSAVDGLIEYVATRARPDPMSVWALVRSVEARAIPTLLDLLETRVDDPDQSALVYQALMGLLLTGATTPQYRDRSLAAIQRAASDGHGDVAETAQGYLDSWRRRGFIG